MGKAEEVAENIWGKRVKSEGLSEAQVLMQTVTRAAFSWQFSAKEKQNFWYFDQVQFQFSGAIKLCEAHKPILILQDPT